MENEVKEPGPKYHFISPEDYLAMERSATEKHQYYNGEVFAMSGASLEHNRIFHNIYGQLFNHLKGKNCTPYGSDLRVHIPSNSLYTYPDISIVCGTPDLTDEWSDTITNPAVIIEILSKSTADYDRGGKFTLYRSIPSLKEYILIDSMQTCIEIFSKQFNGDWLLSEYKKLTDLFEIKTISFRLLLQEVYTDVFSEK